MIENGVITAESPVRLPLASIHTPISTIAVIIVKKAVRTHSAAARTFPDFFSRSRAGRIFRRYFMAQFDPDICIDVNTKDNNYFYQCEYTKQSHIRIYK